MTLSNGAPPVFDTFANANANANANVNANANLDLMK